MQRCCKNAYDGLKCILLVNINIMEVYLNCGMHNVPFLSLAFNLSYSDQVLKMFAAS